MDLKKGLKRLAAGGILLRELRGIRLEQQGIRIELGRIADALELQNAHAFPQRALTTPSAELPPTEVSYVDNDAQAELLEIELGLTRATGLPPSEDEVVAEFERRREGRG